MYTQSAEAEERYGALLRETSQKLPKRFAH
jgi:hypothetical protein